jgi:hypothetical protein
MSESAAFYKYSAQFTHRSREQFEETGRKAALADVEAPSTSSFLLHILFTRKLLRAITTFLPRHNSYTSIAEHSFVNINWKIPYPYIKTPTIQPPNMAAKDRERIKESETKGKDRALLESQEHMTVDSPEHFSPPSFSASREVTPTPTATALGKRPERPSPDLIKDIEDGNDTSEPERGRSSM